MFKSKVFFIIWPIIFMGCGKNVAILLNENKKIPEPRTSPLAAPSFFEESAILFRGPLKELSKKDKIYQKITVVEGSKKERRNHMESKKRRDLVIDALHLILKKGEPLYDRIHQATDIKKLTINGEVVEIYDKLDLPGSNLVINAKTLTVKSNGGFDITPLHKKERPLELGKDGLPGENAGNIILNVASINVSHSRTPRLIFKAKGGQGQDSGLGRNGKKGTSVIALGPKGIIRCLLDAPLKQKKKNHDEPNCRVDSKEGQKRRPRDGENAIPGGQPGTAGKGGMILSSIPLTNDLVDVSGGKAGQKAPDYQGGPPGSSYHISRNDQTQKQIGKKGKDAISPDIKKLQGLPGKLQIITHAEVNWVQPGYLKMLFRYARNHYRERNFERAKDIYHQGNQFLNTFKKRRMSHLDKQVLKMLELEGNIQIQKIKSRLDYFGHPIGWIPNPIKFGHQTFKEEMKEGIDLIYNILSRKDSYPRQLNDLLLKRINRYKETHRRYLQSLSSLQKRNSEITKRKQKLLDQLKTQTTNDKKIIHKVDNLFRLTSNHLWKQNKISFKKITNKIALLEEKLPFLANATWKEILFDQIHINRTIDHFFIREKEILFFIERNITLASMNSRNIDIKDEIISIGKDIFLKYRHLVERIYEYSLLVPYPDSKKTYSNELQTNIQRFVKTKKGKSINNDEKEFLIKMYSTKLAQDIQEAFDKSQKGVLFNSISFNLNPTDLKHLNEGGIIYMDLPGKDFFDEEMEDIRIRDIQVTPFFAEQGFKEIGDELTVSFPGQTIIRKNGINYFFETAQTTYEERKDKSFLDGLLGNKDFKVDLGGSSRPAFKLNKKKDSAVLESVLLEIDYSYREKEF